MEEGGVSIDLPTEAEIKMARQGGWCTDGGETVGKMVGAKAQRQDQGVEVRETDRIMQSSGHHSEDFPYSPETRETPLKVFK